MSLTTLGSEPQPSLAWTFESSNVDYVSGLAPSLSTAGTYAAPTGGTITTVAGKRIHSFTSTGTTSITFLVPVTAEILVVAGGGGGGGTGTTNQTGGGGGAGELYYSASYSIVPGTYTVTVGAGGTGGIGSTTGADGGTPTNGGDSIFGTIDCNGGGRGGSSGGLDNGGSGGSGGGASRAATGGASVKTAAGFGNAGGNSAGSLSGGTAGGGGGGGAGGAGGAAGPDNNSRTAGGAGRAYSISGSSITYAIGGAGGSRNGNENGTVGTTNRGNGGRGGDGNTSTNGGNGGSGIVIISYNNALYPAPTYVTGKYGQAISFNNQNSISSGTLASNSYVTYSGGVLSSITSNNFTMAAWVNPLFSIPAPSGNQVWVVIRDAQRASEFALNTAVSTTRPFFYTNSVPAVRIDASSSLTTGVWVHQCVTFSNVGATSSNTLATYYFNGVPQGSSNVKRDNGISVFNTLQLCGDGTSGGAWCSIDDLRIYDQALSAAQVQSIYRAQGMPSRAVQTLAYPYDNIGITSSAAGLWSTRRLRSAYAGPVVNVRRNSDNAQLDFIADQFGNLSNVQSAVTLDTWLTSTTGNVTTWYDQFCSNNFTQSTVTSQPQIVKNAGKWVVFFNRNNIGSAPTFYSRMTIPNQISGIKTILYGINTIANTFETLLGQSGVDNAGFRMQGGNFFRGANGGDRNDFLYTGGRLNLAAGTYFTYWYNNNNYGSSLNIVNVSNPLGQWGLVIGSTPGYTSFGFNSLSDPQSTLTNRAFYGYLSEVAMFTEQVSQVDAGSLYAAQYISRTSSTTLTGTPLFSQLSSGATSSAVGAFSLRAVNGTSARAVNVAPGGTFPPSAMTQTGTNSSTQTLGTGGKFEGSYIASSSTSAYGWGASGAFGLTTGQPYLWQVGNYPAGGGTVSTPTTTTTGATNYNGEWLQFQTPFPINLTGYSADIGFLTSVVLLASTTGATSSWILVDSKSAISVSPITNTGLNFAGYSYFRFVVITSTTNYPLLANVRFFGTVPSLAQDFYADRLGNLLTAPVVGQSLANWLGGATGYVTTWYDQSGKGSHMSCSSPSIQPKIDIVNKWIDFKTSAYFDTSATPTTGPVPYSNTNNYTVTCRHNTIGNSNGGICGVSNASPSINTQNFTNNFRRSAATYRNYWYTNDANGGTYASGNSITFKWDGTNRYLYTNGNLTTTVASSNWWQTSSSLQMIGKTTNDVTMNGEMYNLIMFNTALSDADRTLVEALPI